MGRKKTTKAEFRRFKETAEDLIQRMGFHDYHVTILHEDLGDDRGGEIRFNTSGRWAGIYLNTQRPSENFTPEGTARHEVAHLLTAHLFDLAKSRYLNEEEIDMEQEIIARRLEKVL